MTRQLPCAEITSLFPSHITGFAPSLLTLDGQLPAGFAPQQKAKMFEVQHQVLTANQSMNFMNLDRCHIRKFKERKHEAARLKKRLGIGITGLGQACCAGLSLDGKAGNTAH